MLHLVSSDEPVPCFLLWTELGPASASALSTTSKMVWRLACNSVSTVQVRKANCNHNVVLAPRVRVLIIVVLSHVSAISIILSQKADDFPPCLPTFPPTSRQGSAKSRQARSGCRSDPDSRTALRAAFDAISTELIWPSPRVSCGSPRELASYPAPTEEGDSLA
jgi:hypothetical protein